MRFTRTLQKSVTKTGSHYVLSIPREVAQELQLKAGGLCNLKVKERPRGGVEVTLKAYQDDPLYISEFNLAGFDDYDEPLIKGRPLKYPITKGRSQGVSRQAFKPFLAASRIALKCVKARLDELMATPSGRAAMAIALRKRGLR